MQLKLGLTDRKVQDHCHWSEVSFIDPSTRIGLLSQSFTASSRVKRHGRFTPGILTAEVNGGWTAYIYYTGQSI